MHFVNLIFSYMQPPLYYSCTYLISLYSQHAFLPGKSVFYACLYNRALCTFYCYLYLSTFGPLCIFSIISVHIVSSCMYLLLFFLLRISSSVSHFFDPPPQKKIMQKGFIGSIGIYKRWQKQLFYWISVFFQERSISREKVQEKINIMINW